MAWACFQPASGQKKYRHTHSTMIAPISDPNITPIQEQE
jgi:hypothetical protein